MNLMPEAPRGRSQIAIRTMAVVVAVAVRVVTRQQVAGIEKGGGGASLCMFMKEASCVRRLLLS